MPRESTKKQEYRRLCEKYQVKRLRDSPEYMEEKKNAFRKKQRTKESTKMLEHRRLCMKYQVKRLRDSPEYMEEKKNALQKKQRTKESKTKLEYRRLCKKYQVNRLKDSLEYMEEKQRQKAGKGLKVRYYQQEASKLGFQAFKNTNKTLSDNDLTVTEKKAIEQTVLVPELNGCCFVTNRGGTENVIGFGATISSNISSDIPEIEDIQQYVALPHFLVDGVATSLLVASQNSKIDKKRSNNMRSGTGLAEVQTNTSEGYEPEEIRNEYNCVYPRVHALSRAPRASTMNLSVLRLTSKVVRFVSRAFKDGDHPDPFDRLRKLVGPLQYPFNPVIQEDPAGRPYVTSNNQDCRGACEIMHRISQQFTGGNDGLNELLGWVQQFSPGTTVDQLTKGFNLGSGPCQIHQDKRDVGKGGELLALNSYLNLGMHPVGCDEETLQMVIIVSKNVYSDNIVGFVPGDCIFKLQTPEKHDDEQDNGIRVSIFMMDYSMRYHGNVPMDLPDDAWAWRITTYATVAAVTWGSYIQRKSREEARRLLSQIYKIPSATE